MAEGEEFEGTPSGISTSAEAVVGQARSGPWILGCKLWNHHG